MVGAAVLGNQQPVYRQVGEIQASETYGGAPSTRPWGPAALAACRSSLMSWLTFHWPNGAWGQVTGGVQTRAHRAQGPGCRVGMDHGDRRGLPGAPQ